MRTVMDLDFTKWNRRMLNSLWLGILISCLVSTINLFFTEQETAYYLSNLIILPAFLLISIMLLAEVLNKCLKRISSYVLVLMQTIICAVISVIHYKVDVIDSILLFPVFTAILYFDRKVVYLATSLASISYVGLQFLHPDLRKEFNLIDFITFTTILLLCCFFSLKIMQRIEGMLSNLRSIITMKNDLLVRGIVLEKETKTDKLTGLYNRAAFHEFLNVLTNEESKIHFQLALFDLDNFKNINDTYGHRVGDTVLQRVSECIRNAILPDDVAARIGGEEFAIILTGKSIEESFRFLERLRTSIAEMNVVELSGNPITISAGLQQYDGKMSKENLFELADVSLYKAKRSGKNNIIINFLSDLCELTETVNR